MLRVFDLLMKLYPAAHRREFSDEMRPVFLAMVARGFLPGEVFGLIRGAAAERYRQALLMAGERWHTATSMALGAGCAIATHLAMYRLLLPIRGSGWIRTLERLASHLAIVCLLVGVASAQPVRQNPDTLELARSIYRDSFTALRQAQTLDDMKKLADKLDSPDWISVDRFGRTILTRHDADAELKSMLALPPERRVTAMEIIWAERDSDRMTVVAWMMPNEVDRTDAAGDFGPKDATHRLTRSTLIRDIFEHTSDGWRRIRHDKLIPNDTVLAVDGKPRIVPPLEDRNRVTPAK